MLAPVGGPMQKLFLSIQHHRNDEAMHIINSGQCDVSRNSESGYGPIHIACKYGNRYVFDLLVSRGVSMETPDANGNSPLHYAAKGGAIDICRHLVDSGCDAARKNASQQTPYDISQSHVVRQ